MSRQKLLWLALFLPLWLWAESAAEAIPAFARKYQFSCSTCHAPAPRLKAFGEEFAGRGFRLEDPAQEPPRATYDVGDPLLQLPRDFPLAARMDGFADWKEDAARRDLRTHRLQRRHRSRDRSSSRPLGPAIPPPPRTRRRPH